MTHWEERLSTEQLQNVAKALDILKAHPDEQTAEHVCYDELTNNGMTTEEADELITLTLVQVTEGA